MKATQHGDLDCDSFARGLLELRNTPGPDGRSPAQVLFGHPMQSTVPAHHRAFAAEWQRDADACDRKTETLREQTRERYDSSAKPLRDIRIGMTVHRCAGPTHR